MIGYHPDEHERYNHLSLEFSKQNTELIAGKLVEELENTEIGTFWAQSDKNEKTAIEAVSEITKNKDVKSINT